MWFEAAPSPKKDARAVFRGDQERAEPGCHPTCAERTNQMGYGGGLELVCLEEELFS